MNDRPLQFMVIGCGTAFWALAIMAACKVVVMIGGLL